MDRRRSSSPGTSARATFSKFKGSMPDKLSNLQTRVGNKISQVPDKLSQVPEKLSQVPDKLQDLQRETYSRISVPATTARAPAESDPEYDPALADLAKRILYRAGVDPVSGGPLLVLCAASFPDAKAVDYNALLPYLLSILPSDEELGEESDVGGYSVVFFAGGGAGPPAAGGGGGGGNGAAGEGSAGTGRGNRPSWAWTLQAYHLLGRAAKKRIRKLWVVHERAWVRVILEVMAGVVSVKFRKKVVHLNTITDLANQLDITQIHIPPAVYLHDRKLASAITIPNPPPPIFSRPPFHNASNPPRVGENMPLPQVLADTARYLRSSCLSIEGLFRITPSQALLDIVREAYDRKQYIKWREWGPHTAAGLVKLYYRSLPEPVVSVQFYQDMFLIEDAADGDEKVFLKVKGLLEDGLPRSSRVLLLRHLLPLMALVAQHSEANKMNPKNLAVCIAPSLLRSDDMMTDARACNGLRRFLEVAIERIEELAPGLPSRAALRRSSSELSSAIGIKPPTPTESPPPYSMGSIQPVPRKKLPGIMGSKEMSGGMTPRKPAPSSASSSVRSFSLTGEADARENVKRSSTPGVAVTPDELPRRGSVPTISTMPADSGRPGELLRRKASFQSFTTANGPGPGPSDIGRKPPIFSSSPSSSSSLTPDPSPSSQSQTKSPPPLPRVVRRAASSNFPSSSSSSPAPSSVAAIANSLNQSQQAQMTPRQHPRTPKRASTENWGPKGRGKVVEELRALYEERARGVEVLAKHSGGGSGGWKR